METQQTIQFEEGGSNPTSPYQLRISRGQFKDFTHLLKYYHYKSNKIGGGISYHLVLKYEGRVYGGIVIGKMRHSAKYAENAVELRRMVLSPLCPKNTASYFLSKCIWWLKKNTEVTVVYTFADLSVGHKGTCYKASNFVFVKQTPPSTYVLWRGKRYHPRSLTIDRPYSYEMREDRKKGLCQVLKGKPKLLYRYEILKK